MRCSDRKVLWLKPGMFAVDKFLPYMIERQRGKQSRAYCFSNFFQLDNTAAFFYNYNHHGL